MGPRYDCGMWLFRKLREVEWMLSLSKAAADYAVSAGIVASLVAMIAGAVAALWSAAAWIDQFGVAGWVISAATAAFVCLLLTGTAAWAWHSLRTAREGRKSAASETAAQRSQRERATDESLRRTERSVFLLLTYVADEAALRALWTAYRTLPQIDGREDDEARIIAVDRLKAFASDTLNSLTGTRWQSELSSALKETGRLSDIALRSAPQPDGKNPFIYREYFIAINQLQALESFLKNAISETEDSRNNVTSLMRDRRPLHHSA